MSDRALWLEKWCPTCRAAPGARCRVHYLSKTRPPTPLHVARGWRARSCPTCKAARHQSDRSGPKGSLVDRSGRRRFRTFGYRRLGGLRYIRRQEGSEQRGAVLGPGCYVERFTVETGQRRDLHPLPRRRSLCRSFSSGASQLYAGHLDDVLAPCGWASPPREHVRYPDGVATGPARLPRSFHTNRNVSA